MAKELVLGGWSNWSQKLAEVAYEHPEYEISSVYDVLEYDRLQDKADISLAAVGITEEDLITVGDDEEISDYDLSADFFYIANHVENHEHQARQLNAAVNHGGALGTEKGYAEMFDTYGFDGSHEELSGITNSLLLHYIFKKPSMVIGGEVRRKVQNGHRIENIDISLLEGFEDVDTSKVYKLMPENGGIAKDFLTHGTEVVVMNLGAKFGELMEAESAITCPEMSEDYPSYVRGQWELEGESVTETAEADIEAGKGLEETEKTMEVEFDDGTRMAVDWQNTEGGKPQKYYAEALLEMAEHGAEPLIGREERENIERPVDAVNREIGLFEEAETPVVSND